MVRPRVRVSCGRYHKRTCCARSFCSPENLAWVAASVRLRTKHRKTHRVRCARVSHVETIPSCLPNRVPCAFWSILREGEIYAFLRVREFSGMILQHEWSSLYSEHKITRVELNHSTILILSMPTPVYRSPFSDPWRRHSSCRHDYDTRQDCASTRKNSVNWNQQQRRYPA
jgi:hypothetical protein